MRAKFVHLPHKACSLTELILFLFFHVFPSRRLVCNKGQIKDGQSLKMLWSSLKWWAELGHHGASDHELMRAYREEFSRL